MAHPFFDALTYPFRRADAQALYQVLWKTISNAGRIDLFYRQAGAERPLALGRAADEIWKDALDALVREQRLRRFCDVLLADGSIVAIHGFVLAVVNATGATDQVFVGEQVVFLDRKRLRVQLVKLAHHSAESVLLVRGPSKSGKSWTQQMVTRLADDLGASSVYLFEGIVSTVEEVVEQLFAMVGGSDLVPPRLGSEEAWFKKVCLKLQELAQARKEVIWIVADDLGEDENGPRLDITIRRFFEQFVLTMANPAFARWFRVILLDYPDGAVPTKWRNVWCEDRPDAGEIDEDVLKDFLVKWANIKQKNLGNEKAAEIAAEIIAKVTAAEQKLPLIHSELNGVLESL